MFYKKGLSSVVATVALILITFAAVAIISSYVVPLVKNNLEKSSECLGLESYFNFEESFNYNCFSNGLYAISVSAGTTNSENLAGFKLAFLESSGETISASVIKNSPDFGFDEGKIRRFNGSLELDFPKNGEARTYLYNNSKSFESAEIYPVLKSDRICPKSDSIQIGGIICETNL